MIKFLNAQGEDFESQFPAKLFFMNTCMMTEAEKTKSPLVKKCKELSSSVQKQLAAKELYPKTKEVFAD